jgi:hypothetical protein
MAEAGFNEKCIVLRAACLGPQFYIVPLSKTRAMQSRVYVVPINKVVDPESREAGRQNSIGPLSKAEFQAKVRQLNNGALVPFDPELTVF